MLVGLLVPGADLFLPLPSLLLLPLSLQLAQRRKFCPVLLLVAYTAEASFLTNRFTTAKPKVSE